MTVAGWIRGRCLDRCRRDRADPTLWARPVGAIAAKQWDVVYLEGLARLGMVAVAGSPAWPRNGRP
jgi:hypothetical protein